MYRFIRQLRALLLLLFLLVLVFFVLKLLERAHSVQLVRPVQPPTESGPYELYFCSVEDCRAPLLAAFNRSTTIKCAFYDLGDPAIIAMLRDKRASVLVFEKNDENYGTIIPNPRSGLMHDKFCILDNETVITGSLNPTVAGITKNDNNLFIIHGELLAQNYLAEFEELEGRFGGTSEEIPVEFPILSHTVTIFNITRTTSTVATITPISTNSIVNSTFLLENYFCPEDDCQGHLLAALNAANESIEFLTYSFTDDEIGKLLVQKKSNGVAIRGVFEKQQQSKYSEYTRLKAAGCDVRLDGNPSLMHHKVFLIDRSVVIFGSYNPSANGNTKNDENYLIVHDAAIAERFEGEFARVYALSVSS